MRLNFVKGCSITKIGILATAKWFYLKCASKCNVYQRSQERREKEDAWIIIIFTTPFGVLNQVQQWLSVSIVNLNNNNDGTYFEMDTTNFLNKKAT